jgi:hypothetical protein
MSFDARSRERLEALGRRLPQKLPLPAPPAAAVAPPTPGGPLGGSPTTAPRNGATRSGGSALPRHRLETEENPENLFRALMQASTDGSVPAHLLERLRELEQTRPISPVTPQVAPAGREASGIPQPARVQRPRGGSRGSRRPVDPAEGELYAAFDDLLGLEDDDTAPLPPRPSRPDDARLLPRPSLRRERPGG